MEKTKGKEGNPDNRANREELETKVREEKATHHKVPEEDTPDNNAPFVTAATVFAVGGFFQG